MIFKRLFGVLSLALALTVATPFGVYADDEDGIQDLSTYIANESGSEDVGSDEVFNDVVENYIESTGMRPAGEGETGAGYSYSYEASDGNTYYFKKSAANNILKNYNSKKIASTEQGDLAEAQQEVNNMVEGLNLKPDMQTATVALSGFSGIISMITGVIIVAITLLMVLVTVCDLCYINLPMFREKQDMGNKSSALNTVISKLISNEARYAVKECSIDSGKNAGWTYLGKRVWSYIILALALLILFTGNINVIINIILTGAGGIFDALKALAGA